MKSYGDRQLFQFGQVMTSGVYTYGVPGAVVTTAGTVTLQDEDGNTADFGTCDKGTVFEDYDIAGFSGTAVLTALR